MQIVRRIENHNEKRDEINEKQIALLKDKLQKNISRQEYGLAIDIGTTTIAMSCYDLSTGEWLGNCQEMNSQCMMGSDVVMRLMHCQQGKQERLQRLVVEQLEEMAEKICKTICSLEDIRKMTVVGNATMCHIFAGQDAIGLAGSTFRTAYQGTLRCKGE